MLYPKNSTLSLSRELFQNPTAEYRATPFWAWNCALTQETLDRQIDCMQRMGFGGFHMHVRVGMETEYLSDDFMALVRGCVEKARGNEMLAWLYDEDKWPSGFAGGYVTKDAEHREKFLLFTRVACAENAEAQELLRRGGTQRAAGGVLLARYRVTLDADGALADYARLAGDAPNADGIWYAYLQTQRESSWHNLQTYVDTLSKKAIERFVEVTHERYLKCCGDEFGKLVPAIFTDEPQFAHKSCMKTPFSGEDVVLPFTTDFPETFQAAYGEDILEKLPELFWEQPQGVSLARYRYHDHVAERFAEAFADTIGNWCEKYGIMLTGHMMEEPTLWSQTAALGDCMRSYRSFQLPGIDMLCDKRELTTAKQAQSAAHQYGRPGVLSELYGVTNWDFDFRHHKMQGDWQAALGVSVRVPHLYWVSMRGEAKRDYPASIGHQSPWYEEYKYLEDHFARVNSAMTRGKPVVKIGVVHPVESYWLHWGSNQATAAVREDMDERFLNLADWLLYNTLDFNYICESLLPSQFRADAPGFAVGEMQYDVVLVPSCEMLRGTTLDALEAFRQKGGRVVFAGEIPQYVDALPSERAAALAQDCICVPWQRSRILDALEPNRTVSVFDERGFRTDNLIYQLRQDNDCSWLFVCNVNYPEEYYRTDTKFYTLELDGLYSAQCYDTLSGEIAPCTVAQQDGKTRLRWESGLQDSLLLCLTDQALPEAVLPQPEKIEYVICGECAPKVPVTLAEPNVLVLDMPEFRMDDGEWQPAEEVLRISDGSKAKLGMRNDIIGGTQPWVLKTSKAPEHTLHLRFTVQSDIALDAVTLALEDLDVTTVRWNGETLKSEATGWYVDEAIRTLAPIALQKGENILEIDKPFDSRTTVENCHLLGDFGVAVQGRFARITEPVRELTFGSWVHQGLPFYGGSVTYHCSVSGGGKAAYVECAQFRQPVLSAALDGETLGVIALCPYRLPLGELSAGEHKLDITAFGNRINTFGEIHNSHFVEKWYGPNAWRSDREHWSYEYRLWDCGILTAPRFLKEEAEA